MKIYQVGGAVRDKLLGRPPHDVDYVVIGATSEMMKTYGFKEVGRGFPVFLHPISGEEYALARKEIKTGPKHTDFKFVFDENVTLREDLERRDFTCNAIAYDEANGQYTDYFSGRRDIENKILRHINAVHFVEDPLRVLRLCRFAAQLDFTVAPETLELCRKMTANGMLRYLTAERVWNELYKAMNSHSFYRFIETARQVGALGIILSEVEAMWQVPEKTEYHPEGTTGGHVLTVLQNAKSESALVNFAVLLHDIGKTLTPSAELPAHIGHENKAKELIYQICRRLKAPNRFKTFAAMAAVQHMKFHYIPQMCPEALYDLAESMTLGHICCVEEYIAVCRADILTTNMAGETELTQSAEKLRHACRVIAAINAEEMPCFAQLPKDESFKQRLREYKISVLRQNLDF